MANHVKKIDTYSTLQPYPLRIEPRCRMNHQRLFCGVVPPFQIVRRESQRTSLLRILEIGEIKDSLF